ncbi:MAG: polysaccharide deacetylase family protein, partial [Planctomycetota bacterium]
FTNPYYVGLDTAKLVTPQWVGEPGVEAVVVLSIDDMKDPAPYESFLRPILERLKKIDGRGPASIMTTHVDVNHPQLQAWFQEGVSVEAHTYDHPCPCLFGDDFARAKSTYDRSIDLLWTIPNHEPVAFRMPCCDSMNSVSPRFFAEMFNKTTPEGHFLRVNSSVFMLFTPNDPALPRGLVIEEDGRQRFGKYVPRDRNFVNYVEDYPYPYVIGRLCWEMPSAVPDDWQGHNLFGPHSPPTVRDMKAAIDATLIKQGAFTLTHHPGGWIRNDQVIELVEHAVGGREGKVKFLNFQEVHDRLTKNLLGGHPLRADNGQDNGVRLLDVNHDGYMDVVIGNEMVRQTRVWSPETGQWTTADFPVELVRVDPNGNRRDAGVQFGVLRDSGSASIFVRNERAAGLWHFDGGRWVEDPQGLNGLDLNGPVFTSVDGRDRGVRLYDLDRDGLCELLVGDSEQQGVFRWVADRGGWERLPFSLPPDTTIVDARGGDAGLRLVDLDVDGHADVVFSNADRYSVHCFTSMAEGWSKAMLVGRRGLGEDAGVFTKIPPIVRADGSNNGAWFKFNHMWVQNEETGKKLPHEMDSRHYTDLLGTDREPPPR